METPSAHPICTDMPPDNITVGHDCAGLDSPLHALDLCGIPYTHVFSSDIDEHALSYIRINSNPHTIYRDIRERDLSEVPRVNLYICGFNCQPYSKLNLHKHDTDPRKQVADCAIEYIKSKLPDCWLLENVKGILSSSKGKDWERLTTQLDGLREHYHWDWRVLDAQQFGTPQSRARVWLCGILKREGRKQQIPWPSPVPLKHTCLDLMDRELRDAAHLKVSPCYLKMLTVWGVDWENDEGCVEFNGSSRTFQFYKNPRRLTDEQRRSVIRKEVCHTMIRHDPGMAYKFPGGIRFCTVEECMRLMGFDSTRVKVPNITQLQMKMLLGNSMCVNVLRALLPGLVEAINIK